MSDYDLRGRDIDQVFADTLTENCIDAGIRASAHFDAGFPGWQLYCKIVRGEALFDRHLDAWAIRIARGLSRATKKNGQQFIKPSARGSWVAVAALDALHRCVSGHYLESGARIADRIGVRKDKYYAIRSAVAGGMIAGFENYRAELHYQYLTVLREHRRAA